MGGFYEFGASSGHVMGMDVVKLIVRAQAQARSDGKQPRPPERLQKANIDAGEISDIAEAAFDIVVHQGRSGKTSRIGGADANRWLPFRSDSGGKLLIQQAGEYHDRRIASFLVCDAQGGHKLALDPHPLQRGWLKFAATAEF